MAVDLCILAKAAEGLVNSAKAKQLAKEVSQAVAEGIEDGSIKGPAAERVLAEQMLNRKLREQIRKRRMTTLQKRVVVSLDRDFQNALDRGYGVDAAMKARYAADLSRQIPDIEDVDTRINSIRGRYHSKMGEVLQEFRSKYAGLHRNLSGLDDMIHVMHGKHGKKVSNPAAQSLGKAMTETMEYARVRYNAAGGDIPKREDWGFFQTHDPVRLAAVERQDWIDFVMTRLAPDRMTDANGLPMSARQVERSLDNIYDSATTRGLSDLPGRDPGPGLMGSNINQRANARFLVFKDSTSWLEYQREFGTGGLYDHIITSLDRMARDTAILEILGPYPEATLRYQERLIDKASAQGAISLTGKAGAKAAGKIGAPKTQLQALYKTVTGRTGITANERLSVWAGSVRAIMTSATLGGAFLSAIADTATVGLTARMAGVSPLKVWGRMARTFALNSTADRRLAINLNFAAQGWASRAIAAQRVLGEAQGARWTELMTDSVLRASFLSPWTEGGRIGWQVEMLSFITTQAGKPLKDIDPALRRTFETHGLTEEMWDVIRKSEQWVDEHTGAKFLRAEEVQGTDFEGINFQAANKLQDVVLREMEYAVPGANARVRAAFTQGTPAGTFWGEVMRNTAMFKSFPISIMALHWQRLIRGSEARTKAEYAAWLFIGMTGMGMVGEQLTSLSRGRDPESLTSPALITRAVIRGGSGGLLGDTLLQGGRYGASLDTLLGPIWSLAQQGVSLTVGNLQQALEGEETNAGRELSRFVEQNMPGRSTWYARLAFERLVFDNLDRLLDPQAEREFAKIERRYRQDRHQQFFSRPGRGGVPQRTPDFSQMLEEAR
jgi:hypothetical protein